MVVELLASFSGLAPSVAAVIAAGGVVIGGGVAVYEYRLKARAQAVEANVRLFESFARLIPLANGRDGTNMLSGSAVEHVLATLDESEKKDAGQVRERLKEATVSGGVGRATQVAAIVALGELARNHRELLLRPAQAALEELRDTLDDEVVQAALGAALDRLS